MANWVRFNPGRRSSLISKYAKQEKYDAPVTAVPPVLPRGIELAAHRGQQWVPTQLIMVVGIFVAQSDSEHSLAHHLLDRMF